MRSSLRLFGILLGLSCACTSSSGPAAECGAKCDNPTDDAGAATFDAAPGSLCDEGSFPSEWISGGPECGIEAPIQVHRYDQNTFILRQSLCTSAEAPFLYLLFGEDTVLLEDTGDDVGPNIPLVTTVDSIIDDVLAERGQSSIELVVVNSHAHGDHTAYNEAFTVRPNTTVVGFSLSALQSFFGIASWPEDVGGFDLGERAIDVLAIPGHQASSIALYDRNTGLLLTGDTFYPGRLFISELESYKASIRRLVDFTEARELCHILGTHIEMTTTPGEQYDFGATHHPAEHELALGRAELLELDAALQEPGGGTATEVHNDFIIFPL